MIELGPLFVTSVGVLLVIVCCIMNLALWVVAVKLESLLKAQISGQTYRYAAVRRDGDDDGPQTDNSVNNSSIDITTHGGDEIELTGVGSITNNGYVAVRQQEGHQEALLEDSLGVIL